MPDVDGVVVVRDHEVPLAARRRLEIRAEGLWAELWCETPGEHWTFGLEAFGVRLDASRGRGRPGGEIGERVAVGLDIEWEVGADGRARRRAVGRGRTCSIGRCVRHEIRNAVVAVARRRTC